MNELVHHKEQRSGPGIFPVALRTGEWRILFTEKERAILIAEALNSTVADREFRQSVVGYLITERSVRLVLRTDQWKIHRVLHCFYDHLRSNIKGSLERRRNQQLKNILEQERMNREELFEHLFRQLPFTNDNLARLITGREVNLPYYDPALQRLKDKVQAAEFCSAIDYGGAFGPVNVKVMKKKEWEKLSEVNNTKQ
jgi:hypothetical protein